MGPPESQPIHAFNTLILQDFSKVIFLQLAVAGKPRETLHAVTKNFAEIAQVLIARSENNRCEVVGLLVPRILAWPATACHLNLTLCGDTKPSMRRDVSDWNVKF
jgi:hypothetical protein